MRRKFRDPLPAFWFGGRRAVLGPANVSPIWGVVRLDRRLVGLDPLHGGGVVVRVRSQTRWIGEQSGQEILDAAFLVQLAEQGIVSGP